MPASATLSVAHVTPYVWEDAEQDVNRHVRGVADELARRGHRVLIVAPSNDSELVRAARATVRDEDVLPEPGAPPRVLALT
ncbi:MAG: histidinol-phosphatase, partial [Solirubrobacterales bacterium]|nr:histidinol-phosphatase [Solirubrobacterales bacterium]